MQDKPEQTMSTPGVIDKYKDAGKIANFVLTQILDRLKVGVKVVDACILADRLIEAECAKIYNKKPMHKGVAFPTCFSINEVCGHYSPLREDNTVFKEGDVVKIDLGVHIDGYIALVGHTAVVQSDKNSPVAGRQADVVLAAYQAVQAALRQLKPGNLNNSVTKTIQKVAASYKVNPLQGVLSHELKKHLIDGNNSIINKETFDQRVEDHEFNVNEVYALDVIMSTGEGKPKESDLRCTVYKRALERNYALKTNAGRAFFSEINNRFPTLGFSLNAFEDQVTAKLGVSESLKHDLLNAYPVLIEKKGDLVAQFKITVMILQGGTITITGLPIDLAKFKSENKIQDEAILHLLNTSMDKTEQRKEKKKKAEEGKKLQEPKKVEEPAKTELPKKE